MGLKAEQIIFADAAEAALATLRGAAKPEHASIVRRASYFEQRLLEDCLEGEVIPLPLPKSARVLDQRHAPLRNLYCCDLPSFWPLLYTIVRDGPLRYVYILEIVDHRTYSKWFPGRGR